MLEQFVKNSKGVTNIYKLTAILYETVVQHYASQGLTVSQIAEQMGVQPAFVRKYLDLPSRKYSSNEVKWLKRQKVFNRKIYDDFCIMFNSTRGYNAIYQKYWRVTCKVINNG